VTQQTTNINDADISGRSQAMKIDAAQRLRILSNLGLVAEWQSGPETLSGCARWKLRLSFAPVPEWPITNNNHEHTIHPGNGNGHLPLWRIPR